MSDDTENQQLRVVRLVDGIMAIMAGADMAEAHTALSLAVVTTICTDTPDTATRTQAAEGFTRQVREFARREDIAAWIKASIHWVPRGAKRSQ